MRKIVDLGKLNSDIKYLQSRGFILQSESAIQPWFGGPVSFDVAPFPLQPELNNRSDVWACLISISKSIEVSSITFDRDLRSIDDGVLDSIEQITGLNEVSLCGTSCTDEAVQRISNLEDLQVFRIGSAFDPDAGFGRGRRLVKPSPFLSADCILQLNKSSELYLLDLRGIELSQQSFRQIALLRSVEFLNLVNTGATFEDVRIILKAHPKVCINVAEPEFGSLFDVEGDSAISTEQLDNLRYKFPSARFGSNKFWFRCRQDEGRAPNLNHWYRYF